VRRRRRFADALEVVPDTVVLPHFDTFGQSWVESARDGAPRRGVLLLGLDERTSAVHTADAGWRCLGPGGITLIRDGVTTRCQAGQPLKEIPDPVV